MSGCMTSIDSVAHNSLNSGAPYNLSPVAIGSLVCCLTDFNAGRSPGLVGSSSHAGSYFST